MELLYLAIGMILGGGAVSVREAYLLRAEQRKTRETIWIEE